MIDYVKKLKIIHKMILKNFMRREEDMKWIDLHCDTISALIKEKRDTLAENSLCVDIQRLRKSDASAQFFACYVNMAEFKGNTGEDMSAIWDKAYEKVLTMTAYAQNTDHGAFGLAFSAEDIGRMGKRGCVAGVLTVEEGGVLNGDITRLDSLYDRGIRLMTLTWNHENCIGFPNSRNPAVMEKRLTVFGEETLRRMNELGIIVDVSHLSDGGFWDCIRQSRYPVIASHSNARALCLHPRNLSDEMLRALGEKGGVAGVNFYSPFLKSHGRADAEDIARHAVHMVNAAGEEAVALGSDFDGFEKEALPHGIHGVQDMEKVWHAMEKQGLTSGQIEKIACGNAMRVLSEVWRE